MSLNVAHIRLHPLQLSHTFLLSAVGIPVTGYLAQTINLRELRIVQPLPQQNHVTPMAAAFRANGRLVRV
jgi:hypothetical protein